MLDTYRKIRDILDARERRNALILLGMMLVMGLLDAIGVASIMPFISVISNPDIVHTNKHLFSVYKFWGFTSTEFFLFLLGGAVFIFIVGSLAFKATTNWAMARYAHMRNSTISTKLLQGYLGQPYSWFLNRHTSNLGKLVLSEVQEVTGQCLLPSVQLAANIIVAFFLIALVVIVDPVVAFVAVGIFGGAYSLIFAALRKYLSRIGVERVRANKQRFQVAQEALAGIKEVKVFGLEKCYVKKFQRPAARFARSQANNQVIGQMPRFILEGLTFGGLILIILVLLKTRGGDLSSVLPVVALYAFAGYRLMPALQQIYQSLTKLRFGRAALVSLHEDLLTTGMIGRVASKSTSLPKSAPLSLDHYLKLKNVQYQYPQAELPALDNVTITIASKQTVAFVGSTGAGKTTAVDLILGLLSPESGAVLVDDTPINASNVRDWQQNIGYVPQHFFLTDDTVAANIAFGVPSGDIDMAAVESASRIAELHDFVVNNMPNGYDTMVGERGVRLSGGQRQRVGIARALYHDPDVLILDEATSALDNFTEKAVMDAVHNLRHRKTIIMIAHRMSTVRQCDNLFLFDRGQVIASGTYDQLLAESPEFQKIVNK